MNRRGHPEALIGQKREGSLYEAVGHAPPNGLGSEVKEERQSDGVEGDQRPSQFFRSGLIGMHPRSDEKRGVSQRDQDRR